MGVATPAIMRRTLDAFPIQLLFVIALAGCGSNDDATSNRAGGGGGGGVSSGGGFAGSGGSSAASGSGGSAAGGGSAGEGGSAGSGGNAGGGSGGSGAFVSACADGAAGPTLTSFTDTAPFEAVSGTTYSGLRISNPNGPCITLNGQSNVVITDSDIGPCGGEAAISVNGGSSVTIEHSYIHHSGRGVLAQNASNVVTRLNAFSDINGSFPQGTAIEYDYMDGGGSIDSNCIQGTFGSDVISGFQSSNLQILNNEIHANIVEPSAAGFTIGDSIDGQPGHDNYVAYNEVHQTGGVPPGVFGSSGNTLLEYNCLPTGIQAYQYNGPFVGVTVQHNVIGPGWFVPDTSVVAGWDTNSFPGDGAGCD
jgi:hypothetical protein